MKKLYITISFVLASCLLMAQNKDTKSADKLFNRYEFVSATEAYLKLVNKNKGNSYVYKQLADSYYHIFNTEQAAKWYAKAIEEQQEAETYYRYAQMLKANGSYDIADIQMTKFATLAPNDRRAIAFLKNPNYLEKLNSQRKTFDIKDVNINSEKSDFGAVLSDNILYFASARNESGKKYGWNKEPYLDIYTANYKEDGTFDSPSAVMKLNSKYNDGPATISKDGNTIYFASESFRKNLYLKDKAKKVKYGQINLFKATKDKGEWTNIEALPFNGSDYSTSNPSLSKDGKTLYFSSNMPGSLGRTDIWKVSIDKNGQFGKPENLGPTINTEGRESFPFIADDNKLYFASDALAGYGGYDIFVMDLNKNQAPKNVGKPINSQRDDFSFSYNNSKKIGFFASNKNGQDDLFMINKICEKTVLFKVTNAKTGEDLSEVIINILENENKIDQLNSNAQGMANTYWACDKEYAIEINKPGFESYMESIKNETDQEEVNIAIALTPIEAIITETEIILQEIYFEFDKSNITQQGAAELDKLVKIMIDYPTMEINIRSHTDNNGTEEYNESLSESRAKSTAEYVISKGINRARITAEGYGESEPKVICEKCTPEKEAKKRRSEFLITKK